MASVADTFDPIIDTVRYVDDVNPDVPTPATDGTLVLVGCLGPLEPALDSMPMVFRRKAVAGSLIGGIRDTQEMLDFCGGHDITADVEVTRIQDTATNRCLPDAIGRYRREEWCAEGHRIEQLTCRSNCKNKRMGNKSYSIFYPTSPMCSGAVPYSTIFRCLYDLVCDTSLPNVELCTWSKTSRFRRSHVRYFVLVGYGKSESRWTGLRGATFDWFICC